MGIDQCYRRQRRILRLGGAAAWINATFERALSHGGSTRRLLA